MRYVLGIDTGGSKCDALLVAEDGTALAWEQSTPPTPRGSTRSRGGNGRNPSVVREAVTKALAHHQEAEMHIAARVEQFPLHALPYNLAARGVLYAVDEYRAVMSLLGMRDGIVALAGTGAFVHGVNRQGGELHLDGLGPLLGDHGSGYQIGLWAIRAAGQSGWHARHQTSLAETIYRECGGRAGDKLGYSLIGYMLGDRDRSEIASLASIVNREAEAGDRIAIKILRDAAVELAATTWDVVDTLGMKTGDYTLVGTGSVAVKSRIYWLHYCRLVRRFAPKLKPVRTDLPQAVGMVLSALERMPGIDVPRVRARVFESVRALLAGRKIAR